LQVENFLEASARRFPDKTALVCCGARSTYRDLEERSNRLAHALIALGCRRGERVVVYLDNSVEAVVAIFAILKAGAVFLIVNEGTKPERLAYILNDSRAAALIGRAKSLRRIEDWTARTPHLRYVILADQNRGPVTSQDGRFILLDDLLSRYDSFIDPPAKTCIDIDLAALVYTSGSAGHPKGVMLTHLNIVSAATSITAYLETEPEDVVLNVLPLSFDYGLYQVLMAFKTGATVLLERSFYYPHTVLENASREHVTGLPIVPTMSAILLKMDLRKYNFSSLRYITNTGATLPTPHIRKLRELFPRTKIYAMYGLTECKRVSYLPPEQIDIRPGSVGKAMPNCEVFIVDDQQRAVAQGVVGELVVRGAHVMKGYWEMPEETDRVLKEGPIPGEKVLYTGDLFWMDAEGYLYFVGRRDDIIKTCGEKVSPKEIENVLYDIEGVAEAAIIGIPDEVLGHAIKAVVTLQKGARLTRRDILRHCARRLEALMIPKWVEFRRELPKTSSGKIDKRQLLQNTQVNFTYSEKALESAG